MNSLDILSAENFQLTKNQPLAGKGRKTGLRKLAGTENCQGVKRRRIDSKTGKQLPATITNKGMLALCLRYAVTNGVSELTFKQIGQLHSALFVQGHKRSLTAYDPERLAQRHKRLGGYLTGKFAGEFPGIVSIDADKKIVTITPEGVNVFGSRSIFRTADTPIKKAVAIATRPAKDKKQAAKKPAAKKPAAKKQA